MEKVKKKVKEENTFLPEVDTVFLPVFVEKNGVDSVLTFGNIYSPEYFLVNPSLDDWL